MTISERPKEIANSLVDLRHINNWFGGTRTTTSLLRRVAERTGLKRLSLLEIGAGFGDVPLHGRNARWRDRGLSCKSRCSIEYSLTCRTEKCPQSLATRCTCHFPIDTFDVVSCSLFAHHFEPDELPLLFTEALRVCGKAVLINDLIRSRLHLGPHLRWATAIPKSDHLARCARFRAPGLHSGGDAIHAWQTARQAD